MASQDEQRILVDGEEVLLIRSARRKRTVTADQIDGVLRLRVPHRLGRRQVEDHARAFRKRIQRRPGATPHGDEELLARAHVLSRQYLEGVPQPAAVTWSTRQRSRWGSTTSTTGEIRLSARLQQMPLWVQDGVLVHELAHLIEPGHGPRFQELAGRYPRMKEADAFLEGVSFAMRTGLRA